MKLRQKPNGIWVADFVDADGKRRRESTRTRDKATARVRGRRLELGLPIEDTPGPFEVPTAGPSQPPAQPSGAGMTMDELFRRCELTVWHPREVKSQATIRSNLKVLSALIGSKLVTEIDYDELERLKDELFARGYAAGTVKRKLDMVGKALTMATKWKDERTGKLIITGRPAMPQIDARNSRDRIVTLEEEEAIFDAIDARHAREPTRDWRRFRALIRFLLDTAARLGEATNVRTGDLVTRTVKDPATGEERLRTFVQFRRYRTKNDKPRMIPLTDRVEAELGYLRMAAAPDGRVFPLKPATVWYMWDNIRADLKEAGLDLHDVVLHTFRHTCLTRLAERLPLHKLSEWAGHSDIKVTRDHYLHLHADSLLDGLTLLENR